MISLRSMEKLIPPKTLQQFRAAGANGEWNGNAENKLAFEIWQKLYRRTLMSRVGAEMPPIPTEKDIPRSNPRKRQLPSVYTSEEAKAILIKTDAAKRMKSSGKQKGTRPRSPLDEDMQRRIDEENEENVIAEKL